jgi:hypothetical protein
MVVEVSKVLSISLRSTFCHNFLDVLLISCQEEIGHIDAIIVCNSYWIGEETPCITYGLRGVIHCNLEVGCHLVRSQLLNHVKDLE